MHLTIVLVNWRNLTQTIRCAQALRAWKMLKPVVLIVDNESTQASRDALGDAGVADRLLTSPTNLGYGGGNNRGICAAARDAGSAIMLLNSDVDISEATARQLLQRLDADDSLSIVGPALRERVDGVPRCFVGGRDIARFPLTHVEVDPDRLHTLPGYPLLEVDYVPGTVFVTRGLVYEDVGLLDEQYFFSGEVADFCKRARDRGHKICVDLQTEASHDADHHAGKLRDSLYVYYNLRNRSLYVRKHYAGEKAKYFGYWTIVACRSAAAAVWRGRLSRCRAIVLALVHGYSNRYGDQNAKFI